MEIIDAPLKGRAPCPRGPWEIRRRLRGKSGSYGCLWRVISQTGAGYFDLFLIALRGIYARAHNPKVAGSNPAPYQIFLRSRDSLS